MTREQFAELNRDRRLQDRRGRVWMVTAEPFELHGMPHIVIRSGDLVRQVPDRYADDYVLLPLGSE